MVGEIEHEIETWLKKMSEQRRTPMDMSLVHGIIQLGAILDRELGYLERRLQRQEAPDER